MVNYNPHIGSTPSRRKGTNMITEIKKIRDKYDKIAKHSEYVPVVEVLNDLYHLEQDARLKRIPKDRR